MAKVAFEKGSYYDFKTGRVVFFAWYEDGERVRCAITREALAEFFGAATIAAHADAAYRAAFEAHQDVIQDKARKLLEASANQLARDEMLLTADHFRPA